MPYLLRFFFDVSPSASFPRAFSLASSIRFAVPLLQSIYQHIYPAISHGTKKPDEGLTHLFLNSSGISTDGLPSAFNFASTRGFSSCCVRDGRETYGREDLHSYVK